MNQEKVNSRTERLLLQCFDRGAFEGQDSKRGLVSAPSLAHCHSRYDAIIISTYNQLQDRRYRVR
jgi:hypothetical protein